MMTIQIKGPIVDDATGLFYDWLDMPSTTPSRVTEALKNEDSETVNVDIASNGGDVFAASEIYTALKNSGKKINVRVMGLAASAASVIAMAGDKVSISPTAQIMIHKAWTDSAGNADELLHESNVLSSIDESIANAYVAKTGMKHADVLNLMAQETWLGAKDAVDKGFADEIMFAEEKDARVLNSLEAVPSKAAVDKLLNMIAKTKTAEENSSIKLLKTSEKDLSVRQKNLSVRQKKLNILKEKDGTY